MGLVNQLFLDVQLRMYLENQKTKTRFSFFSSVIGWKLVGKHKIKIKFTEIIYYLQQTENLNLKKYLEQEKEL